MNSEILLKIAQGEVEELILDRYISALLKIRYLTSRALLKIENM